MFVTSVTLLSDTTVFNIHNKFDFIPNLFDETLKKLIKKKKKYPIHFKRNR